MSRAGTLDGGRSVYKGEFSAGGLRHGRGVCRSFARARGGVSTYDGEWIAGRKHGRGVQEYADGDSFDGFWLEGKKHGVGVMVCDKFTYEGEWAHGNMHGRGVMEYTIKSNTSAVVFEGDWVAGRRHGHGVETFSQGDRYMGEFAAGEKNGRGIYRFAKGASYDGEWVNNKRHGRGVQKDRRGTILYAGEWRCGAMRSDLTSQKEQREATKPSPPPEQQKQSLPQQHREQEQQYAVNQPDSGSDESSLLICSRCEAPLPRRSFSKIQLRKQSERRCESCILSLYRNDDDDDDDYQHQLTEAAKNSSSSSSSFPCLSEAAAAAAPAAAAASSAPVVLAPTFTQDPPLPDLFLCPICMEPAADTSGRKCCSYNDCHHKTCSSCLASWAKRGVRSRCPLCRNASVATTDHTFTAAVLAFVADQRYRCDLCGERGLVKEDCSAHVCPRLAPTSPRSSSASAASPAVSTVLVTSHAVGAARAAAAAAKSAADSLPAATAAPEDKFAWMERPELQLSAATKEILRASEIGCTVLSLVKRAELVEIGVALGDRKVIMQEIQRLKEVKMLINFELKKNK